MKSNVAATMLIFGMIIIHSEAASISKTNDGLPGGGLKTLMLNRTRLEEPLTPTPINMTTTESDLLGSGLREKRNIFKVFGSVAKLTVLIKSWFQGEPTTLPPTTTEPYKERCKREQRLHNTIGGDGGRASVMFLTSSRLRSNEEGKHFSSRTSTDETMDKYNLSFRTSFNDMLRSKLNLRSTYKSSGAMEPIGFDENGQHASASMSTDALIDKYDSSQKTSVNDRVPLKLN